MIQKVTTLYISKIKEMKTSLYVIGAESLHEWEQRNNHPSCITLTGNVSVDTFTEFACDFDYTRYEQISFENLIVQDAVYENGDTCDYEEYISHIVLQDGIRLSVLTKLYLNMTFTKSFVVSEKCVFSADYKILVHIPETKELIVPNYVEQIGIGACCGYENISIVKLNDRLKSIEKGAFIAAGMNNINLPDSLVSLGENVFLMSELENIRLSNSLSGIPDGCFDLCFLENIEIPKSVKYIGERALTGLLWVDKFEIPEGVEQIGYNVFRFMDYISLPSTLLEIAPDFYYEEDVDDPEYPPYIEIHPNNKVFFSKDGSLYFKETGLLAIDSKYNGRPNDCIET